MSERVNTLIVLIAQYLLFVLALVAGLIWLGLDRPGKVRLAAEAVLGLAVLGLGIRLAGTLHADPRPFVQNPSLHPLFPHPRDNGFPSDHAAAAGLLTALVLRYRRGVGCWSGSVRCSWRPPGWPPTSTTCRTSPPAC
jgi:undecaprenyl-diphosphatase